MRNKEKNIYTVALFNYTKINNTPGTQSNFNDINPQRKFYKNFILTIKFLFLRINNELFFLKLK